MPEQKFENWPIVLAGLSEGRDLDSKTAETVLISVLNGEATDAQLAAFLVALRQKGETVDELSGLVHAMRSACIPISCPPETIDLVGAGGSPMGQKAALNVSTIASFVAAGAGASALGARPPLAYRVHRRRAAAASPVKSAITSPRTPSARNRLHRPVPIPLAPPVTTTTLSRSSILRPRRRSR